MSLDVYKLYGIPDPAKADEETKEKNVIPERIITLTVWDVRMLKFIYKLFDFKVSNFEMTDDEISNWMKLKSYLPMLENFSNEFLEKLDPEEIDINLGDLDTDALLGAANNLILCIGFKIRESIQKNPNNKKHFLSLHCGILALTNFSTRLEMLSL